MGKTPLHRLDMILMPGDCFRRPVVWPADSALPLAGLRFCFCDFCYVTYSETERSVWGIGT